VLKEPDDAIRSPYWLQQKRPQYREHAGSVFYERRKPLRRRVQAPWPAHFRLPLAMALSIAKKERAAAIHGDLGAQRRENENTH
jgi:hypothetical protein